jgi:hypothetical protein
MATLKIDVGVELLERLIERAVAERRPLTWQVEVELARALGVKFSHGSHAAATRNDSPKEEGPAC